MANPQVFDELSTRLNKKKRPDSGIHNSMELSGSHNQGSSRPSKGAPVEQNDSGRESDLADAAPKKSGVLNSFKKLFKRNKKKSKGNKLTKSEENLSTQIKSRSEPDLLHSNEQPPLQRFNSQSTKQANTSVVSDDEIDKKNSIKDAQLYIRSSLRKLKGKRKKSGGSDSSSGSDIKYKANFPSEVKNHTVELDDSFITKSISEVNESNIIAPIDPTFDLGEVPTNTQRKIETSAARDKIRIAPRDRRRPTRFRSPTSTPLHQIKEDTSRNSAYISSSNNSLHGNNESNSNRKNLEHSRKYSDDASTFTKRTASTNSRDRPPPVNKISAQRSSSTNSRENVNITQRYKPSSLNNSMNGLSKQADKPLNSRSLGALTINDDDLRSFNLRKSPKTSSGSRENTENITSEGVDKSSSSRDVRRSRESVDRGSRENLRKDVGEKIFVKRSTEDLYAMQNTESYQSSHDNFSMIRNSYSKNDERKTSLDNIRENILSKKSNENLNSLNIGSHCGSKEDLTKNESKRNTSNTSRDYYSEGMRKSALRKSIENVPYQVDHNSSKLENNVRRSSSETTFALTNPTTELELPPDFNNKQKGNETNYEKEMRDRPKSMKVRSTEIHDPKKEIFLPASTSSDGIKELGKSLQPSPKPKPRNYKNTGNSPRAEKQESRIEPGFNRASLKTVPKKADFLEKKTNNASPPVSPDKPKPPPKPMSPPLRDFRRDVKGPYRPVSPIESGSSPEFKRLSLKQVPKLDDYTAKDETTPSPVTPRKDTYSPPVQKNLIKKENFELARQRSASLGRESPAPPPKPKFENKPFSFQSRDVIYSVNRSKSVSNVEARRMRQHSNSPNSEEDTAPSWIKVAKSKQQNGETNESDNDEDQTNTKPSEIKSKLNPKPGSPLRLPSPPSSSGSFKLPGKPSVSSTPSRGTQSFKTQSDNTNKDTCIVCGKAAYMFERVEVDKHTLHKDCAKCEICFRRLKVGGIFIYNNKVYCSQHKYI